MSKVRPHLLLTNDDGADSPLFELLIETMAAYADLSIAVPAQEQSWKGKSMTRHGDISVVETEIAGQPGYAIDGTPADCVNIALYNLLERKPDLVVSGINVGLNAGLSLVWASGTVGACLEANIAGIPGLALSQQLSPETYGHWDRHRQFESTVFERLKSDTQRVMPAIWKQIFEGQQEQRRARSHAITHNVNLPFELKAPVLEQSYLGHSWYGQCFIPKPGDSADANSLFTHRMQPFERDTDSQADNSILTRGHVSVTRLDMHTFGQLDG